MKPIIRRNGLRSRPPGMKCPCCGGAAYIRTSKVISPTLSQVYYACGDIECGHTWVTHNEFVKSLSPSAKGPVRLTAPFLRMKPRGPLSPDAPIPAPPDG